MKIDVLTKEVILTESEYNELVARECLTKKEINMNREEAIKNVLSVIDGLTPNFQETLRVLIPELAETDDEQFESYINEACQFAIKTNEGLSLSLETTKRLKGWLEKQKEQNPVAEILAKAGLKPYKDGNQWCILVGDNIQDGICGFGDTIDEALYQLLKDVLEKQKEQNLTIAKSPQINQQPSWSSRDQQILHDILGTYVFVMAGVRDKDQPDNEVQLDNEDKELLDSMEKEMDWLKSLPKRLKR